ncbi:MAG: FAD-binding protein [Candidatus Thermoplasmatota archaeon]|nr:FAD-binding protein [Candidatus Thermoplasmatota archaeon]
MDRNELLEELVGILGAEKVISEYEELLVYDCDALTINKALPDVVVLPESTKDVQAVVRIASRFKLPFVARGAGTGLSGGALPVQGGILISLVRMNRILEVDAANRRAVVQPGVINQQLNDALRPLGFHFAPDPSSQQSCTIGGNVAENAGGPHTLKYGVTTNHVLGLEVVLPDGQVTFLGGRVEEMPGYDLVGLMVGSEGTLGIVTQVVVRLTRLPEAVRTMLAVYDSVGAATQTVSDIIAKGIIPAAVEMMDRITLGAVEDYIHAGYPKDAEAVLLIELDGPEEEVERRGATVIDICRQGGARQVRVAETEEERTLLWQGRKRAFGAFGRVSPSYYSLDGVIPRSRLPDVLSRVYEIGQRHGLTIANVFHAGDGNLHPIILFDERDRDQIERALRASREILQCCVESGGTISGEHGIGLEKMDMMRLVYSQEDLEAMKKIKQVFDPEGLCNPGKIFPGDTEVKMPLSRIVDGLRP